MKMMPKYPIYIISKGRWESRITSRALEEMRVPYSIVVEPQEYENYAAVIDPAKILVLPFSNLGLGGIPARNWCWEHAISIGASFHWILDDNIHGFARLNYNKRIPCKSAAIFRAAEDFCDRYENIGQAGFQYRFFAEERSVNKPFILNTRIFSCILIRNDMPMRWELRYNEDVDLSIRVLQAGYCTVLFYSFLQNKAATQSVSGGNTEDYQRDGTKAKSQMLVDRHPDLASLVYRYGRWHHRVDFDVFRKNVLKKRADVVVKQSVNNYGMRLLETKLKDGEVAEND